jgi:hypothetical protein
MMNRESIEKQIEVEEKSLIDEMIRHDQSLTSKQRADHRRRLGLERFKESLDRISRLLRLNAPDVIVANAVTNLYSRAWTLWEEDMGREMVDRIKHVKREQSHRCVACGVDLPYPVDPAGCGLCDECTITDDE